MNAILLSSGSLSNYGTDRIFEIAREIGFDGVEVIIDARTDTFHASYLNSLVKRSGLPVGALHAPFSFIDPAGWPPDEISRARRAVALAEEVGTGLVVLHGPFFTDRPYLRWLREELPEFQKSTAVVIAVENMPNYRKLFGRLGVFLKGPNLLEARRKKIWNLLPPSLAPFCHYLHRPEDLLPFRHVVLDVTHLATGGYDPAAAFDLLEGRVVHVHLSNFDGREHMELRRGAVDIPAFLRHLRGRGYGGAICLEIMPEYFSSGNEDVTLTLLRDNLELIRANLLHRNF